MQIYHGNITSVNPAVTNVYTVPAGDRIVVRDITVQNLSDTVANSFYVYVAGTWVWQVVLGTSSSSTGKAEIKPWWVMTPGQVLALAVSHSSGVGVVVSGSLYTI
jgi:hypothetical protein